MISVAPLRQGVIGIRLVLVASNQAESKEALFGLFAKGGASELSFLDFNCMDKAGRQASKRRKISIKGEVRYTKCLGASNH